MRSPDSMYRRSALPRIVRDIEGDNNSQSSLKSLMVAAAESKGVSGVRVRNILEDVK